MDQVQQSEDDWNEELQRTELEDQRLEQEAQRLQQQRVDLWNTRLVSLSKNADIAARQSVATIHKTWIERKKDVCRSITARNRDKHQARQLCDTLPSEKQRAEDIVRAVVTEMHETHPTRTLAGLLQVLDGVPLSNNAADDIDDDDDYRDSQRTGSATKVSSSLNSVSVGVD